MGLLKRDERQKARVEIKVELDYTGQGEESPNFGIL